MFIGIVEAISITIGYRATTKDKSISKAILLSFGIFISIILKDKCDNSLFNLLPIISLFVLPIIIYRTNMIVVLETSLGFLLVSCVFDSITLFIEGSNVADKVVVIEKIIQSLTYISILYKKKFNLVREIIMLFIVNTIVVSIVKEQLDMILICVFVDLYLSTIVILGLFWLRGKLYRLNNLSSYMNHIRSLNHDLDNHIGTLSELKRVNKDAAIKYQNDLCNEYKKGVVYSNNFNVNRFIQKLNKNGKLKYFIGKDQFPLSTLEEFIIFNLLFSLLKEYINQQSSLYITQEKEFINILYETDKMQVNTFSCKMIEYIVKKHQGMLFNDSSSIQLILKE